MAYTITIEGKGVIANADAVTNDTGGNGTGDWGFTGSGGVANGLTTDTFLYGGASVSMALSGAKNGWLWFNEGTGLDFTSGTGTEDGQLIYIWAQCPTLGLMATLANVGFGVRIGSSTTDYRTYTFGGTDGANEWNGGWKCFVIDPTKAGSIADGGTFDISAVTHFGIRAESTATAKGDNVFISQIAVGSGLRITGTDTTAWLTAVDYCIDYANRAWGMLEERGGIYYAKGNIVIGGAVDGDGTANNQVTDFSDAARTIQFEKTEYFISSAWSSTTAVDAYGITLEDNGTYATTYTDGVIVGTDNGRSGSTIIGNDNENIFISYDSLTNVASAIENYGTVYRSLYGTIALEPDADHEYFGVSFIDCFQIILTGNPKMQNCTFAETADTDAAILWNDNITATNFTSNSFIANTTGAAIEHATSTTSTYSGLTFSGNTFDILYSVAASTGTITINATNSNPATFEETNPTGNDVDIVNTVTLTLTVRDEAGDAVANASVDVFEDVNGVAGASISQGTTDGSGIYTDSTIQYTADLPIIVRVRKSTP